MIGFKLDHLDMRELGDTYSNTLVHVGQQNPFVTGKTIPVLWKKCDSTLFPKDIKSSNHQEWFDEFTRGKVHQLFTDSLNYLIQDLFSEYGELNGLHLLVTHIKIKEIVFNYI